MSMRALVLAVERLGLEVNAENKDRARLFKSNTILFEQNVTDEIADAVKSLWADHSVKNAYYNSSEFQLNDSAA